MATERISTHTIGLKCERCKEVLQDIQCKCGADHGYTMQPVNGWARANWPKHRCFQHIPRVNT